MYIHEFKSACTLRVHLATEYPPQHHIVVFLVILFKGHLIATQYLHFNLAFYIVSPLMNETKVTERMILETL